MPAISKAEFARVLEVSKPRISQYVKLGLPVLPSGKIDLEIGRRWLANNIGFDWRQEGKGAARARQTVKSSATMKSASAARLNASADVTLAPALKALIVASGSIAARMAVEAGATMRVAYALEQMIAIELSKVADGIVPDIEVRNLSPDWPFDDQPDYDAEARDWIALAARAGEIFDEEGWAEYLGNLPWSQAPAKAA